MRTCVRSSYERTTAAVAAVEHRRWFASATWPGEREPQVLPGDVDASSPEFQVSFSDTINIHANT